MAYRPNNPYIPGDPYSYDLKWIVAQIKIAIDEFIAIHGQISDLAAELAGLKQYVRDYFDNLDISEEVEAKLDEMYEDGTLEILLGPYVAQMVAPGINFYGVETLHEEIDAGDYWLVKIPKVDAAGNRVELKVGISEGTQTSPTWVTDPQTVEVLSQQAKASVAVNGGFAQRANNLIPWGSVIIDGQVLLNQYDTHTSDNETIGILQDGTWKYYDSHTVDAVEMVDDGVMYAVAGLGPIISHGARTPELAIYNARYSGGRWQTIGYNDDYYIIVTTEKAPVARTGLTLDDIATIYLQHDAQEAYVLDSGGSTSTTVESIKLNSNKDDEGLTDRQVATFLYITKPDMTENPDYDEDVSISSALSLVLNAIRGTAPQLALYLLSSTTGVIWDCNDLPRNSVGYTYPNTLNAPPGTAYWHIFTYGQSESAKVQIALRHNTNEFAYRTLAGSTWRDWKMPLPWEAVITQSGAFSLNDLPPLSVYITTSANVDKPDSGRWLVYTFGNKSSSTFLSQIAIKDSNGQIASRFKGSGDWQPWQMTVSQDTYKRDLGTGKVISVISSNPLTLADHGVITEAGYYMVILDRTGTNGDGGSVYLIHYDGSVFNARTVVHESSLVSGPTVTTSGQVVPVSSTTQQSYQVRAIRIN